MDRETPVMKARQGRNDRDRQKEGPWAGGGEGRESE